MSLIKTNNSQAMKLTARSDSSNPSVGAHSVEGSEGNGRGRHRSGR